MKTWIDDDVLGIRAIINNHAKKLNILEKVNDLNNISAIRMLQASEGYSQCFGQDIPFKPHQGPIGYTYGNRDKEMRVESDCGESRCCWRCLCNAYRSKTIPIDKVFPNFSRKQLESMTSILTKNCRPNDRHSIVQQLRMDLTKTDFDSINSFTKKSLIASPKTILRENFSDKSISNYILNSRIYMPQPCPGGLDPWYTFDITTLSSSNLKVLIKLIKDAESFFKDGNIEYSSNLKKHTLTTHFYKFHTHGEDYFVFPANYELNYTFVESDNVVISDKISDKIKDLTQPMLNIDLPVIENTSFDILHKMMKDYPEELESFRSFLFQELLTLSKDLPGEENLGLATSKLKYTISDEVKKLKSDLQKRKIKSTINAVGITLASWTLCIYVLLTGKHNLLSLVGPGGTIYGLGQMLSNYLIDEIGIKSNQVYFLWKLGKTK